MNGSVAECRDREHRGGEGSVGEGRGGEGREKRGGEGKEGMGGVGSATVNKIAIYVTFWIWSQLFVLLKGCKAWTPDAS